MSDAQVQYHPLYSDETAYPSFRYFYRVIARNASGVSDPSNAVGPVTIDRHTLVDELWNDSRMFLRQGKLTFRQNDARKFKEDCHRLTGEPGSAVVYTRGQWNPQAQRFCIQPVEAARACLLGLVRRPKLSTSDAQPGI